jgi:uncharacterized protein (TIGR03435 family)
MSSRLSPALALVCLASCWLRPLAAQTASGAQAVPAPTAAGEKPAEYDVVSVRENRSSERNQSVRHSADGLTMTNVGVKQFMIFAFAPRSTNLIVGLPAWADSARFDLAAKLDEDKAAALQKLPPGEQAEQIKFMMQAVLVDRFQLKFHHEDREQPAYALVIAKGGLKLKEVDPDKLAHPPAGYHPGITSVRPDGQLIADAVSMDVLAKFISIPYGPADRLTVDRTGLTGRYDVTLQWLPDRIPSNQDPSAFASRASIFTAIQEQLGLRLEPTRASFDTVVVDHIEKPSEN